LAHHAARDFQARLSIVDEIALPPRELWETSLSARDERDPISRKIRKIISLEQAGADVLVIDADITDPKQMESAVAQTIERFAGLDGVILSADRPAERLFSSIEDIDTAQSERFFQSQARSLHSLDMILRDKNLNFCVLMTSLASILGGPGYAAISAANQLIDSFAPSEKNKTRWIGINWDVWRPEGNQIASELADLELNDYGINGREAVEVFRLITSSRGSGQIIVSTGDLSQRIQRWTSNGESAGVSRRGLPTSLSPSHPRPDLRNPYIAPSNEVEQKIATIWQKALGIEKVGVDDNFFDLGGDSLIALQAIAELKRTFEFDIPVVSLYERLTTKALAALLSSNLEEASSADSQEESREERMLRRKQFQQKKRSKTREVNT
jgi:acyl carrier protein/NAD(P)-dependent dehydrogenase (short-subunit alcohol dehydrogenase family)